MVRKIIDPLALATEAKKPVAVEVGETIFTGDAYILFPDSGILLANLIPGSLTQEVILTKLEASGLVIHEFKTGMNMPEFLGIQKMVFTALQKQQQQDAEVISGDEDEEAEGGIDTSLIPFDPAIYG